MKAGSEPPRTVTCELSRVCCWLRQRQQQISTCRPQEEEKSLSRAENGPRPPLPLVQPPEGKARVSGEVRIGQAGRGRALGGERPMGAAASGGRGFKERARVSGEMPIGAGGCRQQHNQASCRPPV